MGNQIKLRKEIFQLHQKPQNRDLERAKKNFFLGIYKVHIFLFVTATFAILLTFVVIFIICSQTKLKTLLYSPELQQIKGINAVSEHEDA